jgi:hypothetical protein
MSTYLNLTFPGFSLNWDASGVFLKAGKLERFWTVSR